MLLGTYFDRRVDGPNDSSLFNFAIIQANKLKSMKDKSFKKLTTSHRQIFPDWRLFHLGRWMTPDRGYLGYTGHWDTRGTPDSPARGLHSSLPVSENHNWTQSPRRRKYLINNRNNTGCPKIKLVLGYLTIVITSDSQEHFRGPNRF